MSAEPMHDVDPSEAFRREARARFRREARILYGPAARRRLLRAVWVAASALVALGVWWSLPRDLAPGERAEVAREWIGPDARVVAGAGARWTWPEPREIALRAGRLYLDVEPGEAPFVVGTRLGRVTVHGTRLVVAADRDAVRVDVGSGEASLETDAGTLTLAPGEEGIARSGRAPEKGEARRFSHVASFIAPLLGAGDSDPSEPSEGFAPGVARIPGPSGPSVDLAVVRYRLDVHIEDGMARTTIDQTFFNPTWSRVEGTFLFPLPPDASISRLAMYVDGRLMEGGMAERGRAVEVYENIVRKMKDPAILEWMEGSTFRLRIFPFEARTERRIILSYQQPLESLYEIDRYRFPIRRPSSSWGTFSVHVVVKGAAGDGWRIDAPTYPLERVAATGGDVELAYEAKGARPARDVILEIRRPGRPAFDLATCEADGGRFICVTAAPEVTGPVHRGPRRALFLVDRTGGASASERRAQARLARRLLEALDRRDRFAVVAYGTEPRAWRDRFVRRTKGNVASALAFLEREPFVGAGDLGAAFRRARELFGEPREGDLIFYLGDGIDRLSGLEPERIPAILPAACRFLAIPVNRSFDRRLLSALAARSGGRVIPVSPDDRIAWRAFDIVSALRTPEWEDLSWALLDAAGRPLEGAFHADRVNLRQGEVLRIAGRVEGPWPRAIRLRGETVPLPAPRAGCAWIPRLWAKLRIEALERDSAAEHRDEIVRLGKEYYVMTAFTALLVLENEAMYAQYRIDRGRKDHWALYPAPAGWRGRVHGPRRNVIRWGWSPQVQVLPRWDTQTIRLNMGTTEPVTWEVPVSVPVQQGHSAAAINLRSLYCDLASHVQAEPGGAIPLLGENRVVLGWLFNQGEPRVNLSELTTSGQVWHLRTTRPVLALAPDQERLVDLVIASEDLDGDAAPDLLMGRVQTFLDGFTPLQAGGGGGGGWGGALDPIVQGWLAPTYHGIAPDGPLAPGSVAASGHPPAPLRKRRSRRLEAFLPKAFDLAVTFQGRRVMVFEGGERLVLEGGRAVYLGESGSAVFDPLFDASFPAGFGAVAAWARIPWFLTPIEVLTAGAQVTERAEGERAIVAIDRGGLTFLEIAFEEERPVEVRVVLRDGLVLRRVVYDAWEAIEGRSLPAHGRFCGPDGKILGEVTYRHGSPEKGDRERLAELEAVSQGKAGDAAAPWELFRALGLYRLGDRAALESFLEDLEKKGRITGALRKVARLAAIRWLGRPVIEAPVLDPRAPEVRRWLPPGPDDLARARERALAAGDLGALAGTVAATTDPGRCIAHLERLRERAPEGLRAVLDLWIGELASGKGWTLKAYDALSRALRWKPLAGRVALLDRLTDLALGLNEVEKALEHAMRALEIASVRRSADALGARFARLVEIAGRKPETWRARGREILERWARAVPRDPRPFARLAEICRDAGERALAIRYASQEVELGATPKAYAALAERLEAIGDPVRAAACRRIEARLEK